jgi:hypothetical protein
MLQYVRELGCVFDEQTTVTAAERGDLKALRYLHMNGVPWNFMTLVAAVEADSLPCLEYAHMHGCPQNINTSWFCRVLRAHSLPVLRYVCEHMDAPFASRMLEDTARNLATTEDGCRRRASKQWFKGLDWPLVLYLGRKLGAALPDVLAEAKATRTGCRACRGVLEGRETATCGGDEGASQGNGNRRRNSQSYAPATWTDGRLGRHGKGAQGAARAD